MKNKKTIVIVPKHQKMFFLNMFRIEKEAHYKHLQDT